ncbi:alpha/beta fold hydrolase [Streptomyces sp. NBC_01022]|uniref:alpha/beta fold hydrolase n=1 Tax=Streptomyces sp. NBC_01022 TaxID=2903723 RepID=UPI002DDAC69D|nr:alpha/beta hydrolase [Streptomyces sp. NBC_01022]WRZ86096.1 alpha/beta hydrolase [Streptomyces sp. NBC_01022]
MAAYVHGPADAPTTAVLVHGLSVTADLWRLHTPHLTDLGMRVVRYDQRAHGRSTRGAAPITLQQLATDLAHVIEELAPHGPLVLAGHSMGGMILQTLTTLRPDLLPRVHGLLLISTPDGPVTTRSQAGLRNRVVGLGRDLLAATCTHAPTAVDAVRRRLPRSSPWALHRTGTPSETIRLPSACRRGLHHAATRDIAAFWHALAVIGSRPVNGLRSLGPRLTLLAGTEDTHVPPEHTRALAARIPEARLALVKDATHALPVRHPHLIVEGLTRYAPLSGDHRSRPSPQP